MFCNEHYAKRACKIQTLVFIQSYLLVDLFHFLPRICKLHYVLRDYHLYVYGYGARRWHIETQTEKRRFISKNELLRLHTLTEFVFYCIISFIAYMVCLFLFGQFHIALFNPAFFAHKFGYNPIQNRRQNNHQ